MVWMRSDLMQAIRQHPSRANDPAKVPILFQKVNKVSASHGQRKYHECVNLVQSLIHNGFWELDTETVMQTGSIRPNKRRMWKSAQLGLQNILWF